MKVRIINEDGRTSLTRVLNAETGEIIEGVKSVTIEKLDAGTPTRESVLIQLDMYPDLLDIMGEGVFTLLCPHCHKRLRLER